MINASLVLFYMFGAVLLASSLAVILVKNPVHAALWLVLAFVQASGLWLLLHAEFLAITLVLVYVGAVMVLFLFVVMMLDIKMEQVREGFAQYLPVGIIVALVMLAEMIGLIGVRAMGLHVMGENPATAAGLSNTAWIGHALYTQFLLPFEIAALILTVGIVAAVALTLRHRGGVRHQSAAEQVAVDPRTRMRIVKMTSETMPTETVPPVAPSQETSP